VVCGLNASTEKRVRVVPWLQTAMFQGQSTRLDCFSAEPIRTWSDRPVRRRSRCAAAACNKQAWDGFAKKVAADPRSTACEGGVAT
jgi:hypothetical protein